MKWAELRALLRKTIAVLSLLLAADALGWTVYLTILRSSDSPHLEPAVRGVFLTATVVLAVALIAAVSVWRLERPERITTVDLDMLARLDKILQRLDEQERRVSERDGRLADVEAHIRAAAEDRSMLHDVARVAVATMTELDRLYRRFGAVEHLIVDARRGEVTTADLVATPPAGKTNGNGNGTTYRATSAVVVDAEPVAVDAEPAVVDAELLPGTGIDPEAIQIVNTLRRRYNPQAPDD